LIQWGDRHPAVSMADHGFRIEQLRLWHPEADRISTAWQAAGGVGVTISAGAPRIEATLATPRGAVVLKSA
ncbi:MAG: VOC family protein, partial [Burkholderiaceae bacterium]